MTFQYTEQFPPAAEIHVTRLHLTGEHEPSFFIQCLSKETGLDLLKVQEQLTSM